MNIIAQVILYAGGFENAQMLATKITTAFKICAELLLPETFYDFGESTFLSCVLFQGILTRLFSSFTRFAKHDNGSAFMLQTKI